MPSSPQPQQPRANLDALLDALYFGSVPVAFASVGDATCCSSLASGSVSPDLSAEASAIRQRPIAATRARDPRKGSAIRVTVPDVPGDWVTNAEAPAEEGGDAPTLAHIPPPMIKVPLPPHLGDDDGADNNSAQARQPSLVGGVASGVRSALCRSTASPSWLRLKGCGNNDQGFVLERRGRLNAAADDDLYEQRGCSYEYLSRLELAVTADIARRLDPHGIRPANVAVGFWRYPARLAAVRFTDPLLLQKGVVSQPTCTVMETIGDRRLGTHVLAGIDLLLPTLIGEVDVSGIYNRCVPSGRPREPDGSVVPAGHIACDHHIAAALGMDTPGTTFMCDLDRSSLVDVVGAPGPPLWCERIDDAALGPDALRVLLSVAVREGDISAASLDATVAEWHPLWATKGRELQTALAELSSSPMSAPSAPLLADVMYRLGHECGRFLGGLHAQGYSWGTFTDASCLAGQMHCNAHANNFVLADPRVPAAPVPAAPSSAKCLLGYLDLDMAFRAAGVAAANTPSAQPAKVFAEEHFGLLEVLLGADSSSGVRGAPAAVVDGFPADVKVVRAVLHDTLALGFLDGEKDWRTPLSLVARRPVVGAADGDRTTALFEAATEALLAMAVIVRHAAIA